MKKALMMALLATTISMPALANEKHGEDKVSWMISKMDTNKDGVVSKAEHDAFGDEKFAAADTNKDGNLSVAEMTAAKKEKWDHKKPADSKNQ